MKTKIVIEVEFEETANGSIISSDIDDIIKERNEQT